MFLGPCVQHTDPAPSSVSGREIDGCISLPTATSTFPAGRQPNTPHHHCMQVLENRELQGGGSDRSTRHVQLQLPEGPAGAYSSGEHLEVYGNNDGSLVEAALKLLGLGGARLRW